MSCKPAPGLAVDGDAFRQAACSCWARSTACATFIPVIERSASNLNALPRELIHHRQESGTNARPPTCHSQNPCSSTGSAARLRRLGRAVVAPSSVAVSFVQSTLPLGTVDRCASHSRASLRAATAPSTGDTRSARAFLPTRANDAAALHRTPSGSGSAVSRSPTSPASPRAAR